MSTRERRLFYPGDVRAGVPEVMGPTYEGKPLWPVDASYDEETDRTKVTLTDDPTELQP